MSGYEAIIARIEEMVRIRGLKLELEVVAINPRNGDHGPDQHAHLQYRITGESGDIHLYQVLKCRRSAKTAIEEQIRTNAGVYPAEDLVSALAQALVPELELTYFGPEGYEVEFRIDPDGHVETDYATIYVQDEYEGGVAKLLGLMEGNNWRT